MRPPLLVLATVLLSPAPAAAQPLDLGTDPEPSALETESTAPPAAARLGDLEDQVDAKAPLALEPKLDLAPDDDALSGTSTLQNDPRPAPGLVMKIPTN